MMDVFTRYNDVEITQETEPCTFSRAWNHPKSLNQREISEKLLSKMLVKVKNIISYHKATVTDQAQNQLYLPDCSRANREYACLLCLESGTCCAGACWADLANCCLSVCFSAKQNIE